MPYCRVTYRHIYWYIPLGIYTGIYRYVSVSGEIIPQDDTLVTASARPIYSYNGGLINSGKIIDC